MRSVAILVSILLIASGLSAQLTPTPTQRDTITFDSGTPNLADPGDTIRYDVKIQNTGLPNANGVQLNVVPDPRTTFVPGSFRTSPLAIDDGPYASIGNVGITVPAVSGLRANDFDDNIPALTVTAVTNAATTAGGMITIASDGSFSYNPPAGYEGADSYTYTLIDGNPLGGLIPATNTGVVNFTVSGMIWFINNNPGACPMTCDGRLNTPYPLLSNFNSVNNGTGNSPAAGDNIFVYESTTAYSGGTILLNNQKLIGQDATASLSSITGIVVPTFSNPLPVMNTMAPATTINGTNVAGDAITLAQVNTIWGLTAGNATDFAIDDNGAAGSLTIQDVIINNTTGGGFRTDNGGALNVVFTSINSNGGPNGINLGTITGTFNGGTGALTNATGTGALISGGTVVFTYSGNITGNTGLAVDIDNHDSGNITFQTGNITSSTQGIRVQNSNGGIIAFDNPTKNLNTGANTGVNLASNTGATINFTGDLDITTSTGIGFNATGGGTVNVTGAGNTISSISNTALNVDNTTIGASNLNFLSISSGNSTAAADPSNGITLNVTGSLGGLIVTGMATTDGSGGVIQNITNRGVSAVNTSKLSLKNMTFTSANLADASPCGAADNSGCNAAIHLNTVTTATLDNIDINGAQQQGINLREVSKFKLLNSTTINTGGGSDTEEAGLYALNLFDTCAITSCSLTLPTERAAVIYNTAKTLVLAVTSSTFGLNQTMPLGADAFEISSFGASNTTLDIVNSTFVQPKTNGLQVITESGAFTSLDVTGSTFDPGVGLAAAMDLVINGTGDMDFNIIGNPMIKGAGINVVNVFAFPNGNFEGRINNNTVVNNSGSGAGIRVFDTGNGNSKVEIKDNLVTGANDYGIDVTAQGGTSRLDATITGNTVSISPTGFYAIHALAGASGSVFTNKVCANVASNVTTAPVGSIGHFQARSATAPHEILLQGGGITVTGNWNANANLPASPPAIISQSGAGVFTFGATCLLPLNPMP